MQYSTKHRSVNWTPCGIEDSVPEVAREATRGQTRFNHSSVQIVEGVCLLLTPTIWTLNVVFPQYDRVTGNLWSTSDPRKHTVGQEGEEQAAASKTILQLHLETSELGPLRSVSGLFGW